MYTARGKFNGVGLIVEDSAPLWEKDAPGFQGFHQGVEKCIADQCKMRRAE
jgi:hypothetical protein